VAEPGVLQAGKRGFDAGLEVFAGRHPRNVAAWRDWGQRASPRRGPPDRLPACVPSSSAYSPP
jgi:hypothetical protein